MRYAAAGLLLALLVVGCRSGSGADQGNGEPIVLASESIEEVARNWMRHRLDEFSSGNIAIIMPEEHFRHLHREEILETLETAEVDTVGPWALALLRYSVGGDIFRDGLYLRRYQDRWYPYPYRTFSKYGAPDDIDEDYLERLLQLQDRKNTWEENSTEIIEW